MNKRERVLAALDCRETDRVPIYDLIRNDRVIEHFAGEKLDVNNSRSTVYKAYNAFVDATKSNITLPRQEGVVTLIDGKPYTSRRWTVWTLKPEEYDRKALEKKAWAKIRELKSQLADIPARVEADLLDYQEKQRLVDQAVIFQSFAPTNGGLYFPYNFLGGIDLFTYLMDDNPDLVEELIEQAFQYSRAYIGRLPADYRRPAVLIAEDIAYKGSVLFSPGFLRTHLFGRLKEIIASFHDRGIKVLFHSDGDLDTVLEDLVKSGFDGIHPVETMAGMAVKKIRDRYPRLVLFGGVDCSQLLPFGKPEEVYQVVRDNIRDSGGYGYFAGSSSEINNEVPLANILALYEAVGAI